MKTILPLSLLVRPERTDPRPLVIYHGKGCPDGFAAALAAWIFFDAQADFVGLDHGVVKVPADLPDVAGRAVYILDFSFSADILRAIEAQAAKLVLLDHHKSAADQLEGYVCSCGVVHFDMKKSGARLAWEFFLHQRDVPALVQHVEDRDIWVWQYPQSAAFLAALDMEPFEFARWRDIAAFGPDELADFSSRGQAMDDKFNMLAQGLAENAAPLTFNGVAGLMVNAPGVFHSLVGDILSRKSGTFALMWTVDKAGVIKAGLRSQPGFNCIPLAESMHGGGHAQACGFKLPGARLGALLNGVLASVPDQHG